MSSSQWRASDWNREMYDRRHRDPKECIVGYEAPRDGNVDDLVNAHRGKNLDVLMAMSAYATVTERQKRQGVLWHDCRLDVRVPVQVDPGTDVSVKTITELSFETAFHALNVVGPVTSTSKVTTSGPSSQTEVRMQAVVGNAKLGCVAEVRKQHSEGKRDHVNAPVRQSLHSAIMGYPDDMTLTWSWCSHSNNARMNLSTPNMRTNYFINKPLAIHNLEQMIRMPPVEPEDECAETIQ
ncbi:uncharacterized protein LAESUDRAFT_751870 [Laetiporus sulphureus 93-53]|uniref:Uncharacterized protein n=1 Tax=Laetiporus sulphureus 93-53 TaxID=1314785 RepID=A0A165CIU1_9APHY|nr:uncharacterized protein LAESUDRAFT_751870 [Laetiporus sulphureus 93-53]KZT02888.1 hypothetical protein LAESUDRAFT_751870 [Laetiporus sulphureus 93-53]